MEAVAYSTFRSNLKSWMDRTRDDAEPILVTSKDPSANIVVLNAHDYENMMETFRIYSNPYLADKLRRGMEQAERSAVQSHPLSGDEDE